jgi:hypothetical protein
MNKKRFLIALVVMLFALSACAQASREAVAPTAAPALYSGAKSVTNGSSVTIDQAYAAPVAAPAAEGSSTDSTIQQMVITNADLTIAVDDPGLAMTNISKLAVSMGGFVVSSNISKTQTGDGLEVPQANITVRVSAAKLNQALDQIKQMTGDVSKYTLSENISGQDITQDYTDLKSRLTNLQEADAKLSELYDKAVKPEDALAIYNQKMQITEQIEVIKGQMQYDEQASAKSAIAVTIVDKKTIAPPITVAGWQPKGVAKDAVQALINFGKGLVDFLIWLIITVVPIVAVIGLPIFFFVRWLVRRSRRKDAERQEALRKVMEAQQPPVVKK